MGPGAMQLTVILKVDSSLAIILEKVSIKDIPNQAQSLFVSDKYKFIFDEFITVTSFDKLKIGFYLFEGAIYKLEYN